MPRSGGTLLYQLTKEIAEISGKAKGRGFAKQGITSGVVKTEFCEQWMIERVINGAQAIGSYRDFRDVILSMRDFYNRREQMQKTGKVWTIEDALRHRSEILDSFYCWRKHCNLWFRFEDENYVDKILNVAPQVIGITLTEQQKEAIKEKYSLENNQKHIRKMKPKMDAGPGRMLTKWHISPTCGKSRWQRELTQNEIEMIENVGGEWLRQYGYE